MAGNLEGRLSRAEQEFMSQDIDFIEMENGELVYIGSMQIVDDFLTVLGGDDIDDERARLYVDAIESSCHGGMMAALIKNCQERYREES